LKQGENRNEKGQFPPGQTGNPNGRPKKGASIRGCLRESMADEITIPGKNGEPDRIVTKGEFLSMKLFQIASSGDLAAIKMCLDNIDGPPVQKVETTTRERRPPLSAEDALRAAREADECGEV